MVRTIGQHQARFTLSALVPVVLLVLIAAAEADVCVGDCNDDNAVTVAELISGVNIALGAAPSDTCPAMDRNQDGEVTVDELVLAVNNVLLGCPKTGTLLRGIQFVPDSYDTSIELRSRLLLAGDELIFTDGTDVPVKALSLATGRVRSLVREMGVPEDLAIDGNTVVWTEAQSGIGETGCTGAGVIRQINETTLDEMLETRTLARKDNCTTTMGPVILHERDAYWLSSRSSPNTYAIERTSRDSGTTTTVFETTASIYTMASDETHLYWLEGFLDPGQYGELKRMPFAGGPPEVVSDSIGSGGSSVGNLTVHQGLAIVPEATPPLAYRLITIPVHGGTGLVLADLPAPPRSIAALEDTVYWLDATGLRSVPLTGGEVTTLVDDVEGGVDLTTADGSLTWTESLCCAHGQTGRVRRLDIGETTTLIEGVDAPGNLTAANGMVFWLEGGHIGLIEGFGRVAMLPSTGGSDTTIAAGVSAKLPIIATDGTSLFLVDRFRVKQLPLEGGLPIALARADFYITGLTTDSERVYWVEDPLATVRSVPVGGGPSALIASGNGAAGPIATWGNYVYWPESFFRIFRAPKTGGAAETIVDDIAFLSDLAVDQEGIFYSEQDTGRIMRKPLDGGPPEILAGGQPASWNILALGADSVFWVDQSAVSRAPKAGGTTEVVSSDVESNVFIPNGVTAVASRVYWTEVGAGEIRFADLD